MGFKMKGSPINLGPGLLGKQLILGIGKAFSSLADNDERYAREKAKYGDTSKIKGGFKGKKDFTKDPHYGISPGVVVPDTSQQNFDKLMTLPNAVHQPPTQTPPKKRKKIKTLDTKIMPKGADVNTEATAKTITKKETVSKPGKLRSQKNIRNRKLSNKEGSMTRREIRLMKTLDKASSAKAETNKTAKSIDTSKPKSADTGAKQTSARGTRSKAKRLENRATRIQGRIDRKASRQAQRKKIKENR